MSNDHLERLEALLKRSPGILWEGLTASEVGDVRACLDELKQTRERLAEIGETREEWAADGPAGWFQAPAGAPSEWSERFARGVVEGAAEQGVKVKLKRRVVGEWQDFEEAGRG